MSPSEIQSLIHVGFDLCADLLYERQPPWYMKLFLGAVDAYFDSRKEQLDVDENILEKLKSLPCPGPIAQFDSEGGFNA